MSSGTQWALLILGVGLLGLALVMARRLHRSALGVPPPQVAHREPSTTPSPNRPRGQLAIATAEELLQITGTTGQVEVIRNRLALAQANWEADAWPVIQRYCEFVQLLPASESHHHAQPGGLLIHTLEVASYALTIRQGQKLPAGAPPEEQVRRAAIWSFGVLLGALLHDLAKPVSDVVVRLYGLADAHTPMGEWQALAGAMSAVPGASHYEVDFPAARQRDYTAHQRLAAMMLHAIVPPATMRWLSTDPQLLPALIAYLDGQDVADAQSLALIVKQADSISVADNLRSGPRTRFAKARQAPLIERLMWGLRTLAAEDALSMNRPGATLFFDPDGLHVWAVAGVIADKVRSLIDEREIRQEGCAGIPTDNTRLFDTWHEYGALVPPDGSHGKGSVWWVRVDLEEWSQVLTVLKFRVADLYNAAGAAIPCPLPGQVTPVPHGSRTERAPGALATVEDNATEQAARDPVAATKQDTEVAGGEGLAPAPRPEDAMNTDPDALLESIFEGYTLGPDQEAPPATPIALPKKVHGVAADQPIDAFLAEEDCAARPAPMVTPAVQVLTVPSTAPKPKFRAPGAKPRPDADAFFGWLQQGLGTGSLSFNEADSIVHFTPQGMALVSPRAFKLYLEEHAYTSDLSPGQKPLNALQNDLQRGGYTARNGKSNFFVYWIKQADGTLGPSKLTTYVVTNPQAYIRPVPSPNPLLVLQAPDQEASPAPQRASHRRGASAQDAGSKP